MLVLAKSVKGKEYFYNPRSAHRVSARSAETIRDICNKYKFQLNDNETWHIHEIDKYDTAYNYAEFQQFTIRNGIVTAKTY